MDETLPLQGHVFDDPADLIACLAERRQELKLSTTRIGADMNTSASMVSSIESGQQLRIGTLFKYANALGYSIALVPHATLVEGPVTA
jgi:transcriptional regulator with XRE-family HTH domain